MTAKIATRHRIPRASILTTLMIAFAIQWQCAPAAFAQAVSRTEAKTALRTAATFFHSLNKHGGYDWRYSRDLKLSEGEGETDANTIWTQPPGTPAIGMAFLQCYRVTNDDFYLNAAGEVAQALLKGQLQSGGWNYSISFDPKKRAKIGYRDNTSFRPRRKGRDKNNLTTIDDDTTSSVVRFLLSYDKASNFANPNIRPATEYALKAMMIAQSANGGWYANWSRFPSKRQTDFVVKSASFPKTWSRQWKNDWPGRYFINDDIAGAMIRTMYLAYETYKADAYFTSAKQGGEFLLLAQMPEPQPAWAQQYDSQMHPTWDRKFEPPAISSLESRYAIEALLFLAEKTSDKKWLAAIPPATRWLSKVELENKKHARFYELKTDRPLYFNKQYQITYDSAAMPSHYGFIRDDINVQRLQSEYKRILDSRKPVRRSVDPGMVRDVISQLDQRGAWIDKRGMKGHRKASQDGVVQSDTFIRNIDLICRYILGNER